MKTEQMTRMVLDITNGVPAPANETKEEKKIRATLTKEIDEIRAKGQIVDVIPEMP